MINKILSLSNKQIEELTTSYITHTTVDFVKIKINENLKLIDSPGFSISHLLTDDVKLLKKINKKCQIRPITYQMKPNDTVLIENFATISSSIKNSFTLYINNNLDHKKIYNNYLLKDIVEIVIDNNSDIVLNGIGFISVKKSCKLKISLSDKDLIEVRPSIFGGM